MGYGTKGLNELRDWATKIAVEHGFTKASPAEDIALMHSELSEALEIVREGMALDEVWYEEKTPNGVVSRKRPYPTLGPREYDYEHPYKPCGVPSEIADVIIRALHFAGKHKIDIEQAVIEKMEYNEKRPFKHGGKKL